MVLFVVRGPSAPGQLAPQVATGAYDVMCDGLAAPLNPNVPGSADVAFVLSPTTTNPKHGQTWWQHVAWATITAGHHFHNRHAHVPAPKR